MRNKHTNKALKQGNHHYNTYQGATGYIQVKRGLNIFTVLKSLCIICTILISKVIIMIEYKSFKIVYEYPSQFTDTFNCFVWCKGEHYKSHAYGKSVDDTTWGLGETQDDALKEAIDMYWYYENEYHE